jgi:hypothetical protein
MAEFPMISLCTLYASILWTAVDLKWPECSKQLAKSGMPQRSITFLVKTNLVLQAKKSLMLTSSKNKSRLLEEAPMLI